MVRVSSEANGKPVIAKVELLGTSTQLLSLLSLMNALHETEKRVQAVGKKIWEVIFQPWLKFVTSERRPLGKNLKFQVFQNNNNK